MGAASALLFASGQSVPPEGMFGDRVPWVTSVERHWKGSEGSMKGSGTGPRTVEDVGDRVSHLETGLLTTVHRE